MSHLSQLHYAFGCPSTSAVIRSFPQDFKVIEQLSFSLDGNGQHVYLLLQKRNLNTEQVATSLAKFSGVKPVAVGYAGLKDKNAITVQWFSVDLAGKAEPVWSEFESDNIKVLEVARHGRKLKRGAIRENQFEISLEEFRGDKDDAEHRLRNIKTRGVPNYFGEQRFGANDYNLKKAQELLSGNKKIKRHLRSIYLSSVRSFLFNQVLSRRVAEKTWDKPLQGDVFMLQGSHSVFVVDEIDEQITQRVLEHDIHPTGPMFGAGELMSKGMVCDLESSVLSQYPDMCELLEKFALRQERRALRLSVSNLDWQWNDDNLLVKFALPAGCYATSVLRELINY